jgi:cytochrome c oxidase subunit II
MSRRIAARRLVPALLLIASSFLLSGCEVFSSPQNTFNPAGKVAEDQKFQFLFVMWPALVIMILVLGACVAIPLMFPRKKGDPGLPKQVHGHTGLELTWTIIPAILLAVIAVPTVAGINDLGREPAEDALIVRVEGQRFTWLFDYPEIDAGGAPLGNEPNLLRIPVGREVGLQIYSTDVNHSFWIPKLAGKTDAINEHANHMWIRADEAGTFVGQCAEFCGLSHSDMRFEVIAMPEAEFDAWVQEQGGLETVGCCRDLQGNDPQPADPVDETPDNAGSPTPTPVGDVIELDDNVFVFNGEENPTLTAAAGTDVTFALDNTGTALHNLHIAAGDDYASAFCNATGDDPCSAPPRINGGDGGSITFNLPAGTYDYRCDFHVDEMSGTLEVQ